MFEISISYYGVSHTFTKKCLEEEVVVSIKATNTVPYITSETCLKESHVYSPGKKTWKALVAHRIVERPGLGGTLRNMGCGGIHPRIMRELAKELAKSLSII